MIPLYLCEDEPQQLAHLKKVLEDFILIEALDMQIACATTTPAGLLSQMPSKPEMAVYFLDIDLRDQIDGLALAASIRRKDPRAFIIFTTAHSEMALATFRYKSEALDFLVKDDPDYIGQIHRCLTNVLEKASMPVGAPGDRISFHVGDRHFYLPIDHILFIIGSTSHRLSIHTKDSIYQSPGTLRETMGRLDKRFFQCHRSCLVHTGHIDELDKTTLQVIMDNGSHCPCSLRQFGRLRQILEQNAT